MRRTGLTFPGGLLSGVALLAIFVAASTIGCISYPHAKQECGNLWFIGPPGIFRTNDIERAQREVQFPIILPSYLPPGIVQCPWIRGPVAGEWNAADLMDIGIKIEYYSSSNSDFLLIDEMNHHAAAEVGPYFPGFEELQVDGVPVVRYETYFVQGDGSRVTTVDVAGYAWTQDGIPIKLFVPLEMDRGEVMKVIRSMIRAGSS